MPLLLLIASIAVPLTTINDCSFETWWYCPTINFSPYSESSLYRYSYLWKLGDDSGIAFDLKQIPAGATWKRVEI